MAIGVQHNIALLNAQNQYKVTTGAKAKSSEKLSTGFRINRAADDAAGLSISEKMRAQIRGLDRGTQNGEEGISWIQTGDGALDEVHAILHRMSELTIQSLNDTNTPADRAALQAEFDSLQSEVDRITGTTEFNTLNIFDQHELPYYQCEGNVGWEQSQMHVVSGGSNDLILNYCKNAGDPAQTLNITVPAGEYTTQELIDEIEDAIAAEASAQGLDPDSFMFEFTQDGTCNFNLEGGTLIESVGGGLSYLLYDMYEGGGFGALVGTTVFPNEYAELEISDKNNELSFTVEDFNGGSTKVDIVLTSGSYTRGELIDRLNAELQTKAPDVTAVEYGTGIKLVGSNSIVTGFKGNMFKIDDTGKVYHSVFYDNVKYGSVSMSSAYFTGGMVLPTSADSEEYSKYKIDSTNNTLVFKANGADTESVLTIPTTPTGEYTVGEMATILNDFFADKGIELKASVYPTSSSSFQGLRIDSNVKGITSDIGIDKASSTAYNTLFVDSTYNRVTTTNPVNEGTPNRPAAVYGAKAFTGSNLPLTVDTSNNKFNIEIVNPSDTANPTVTKTIEIAPAAYSDTDALKNAINTALAAQNVAVTAKMSNNKVLLTANDGSGITSIKVSEESGNNGYEDIFVNKVTTITYPTVSGSNVDFEIPTGGLDSTNNKINISLNNGTYKEITLPEGDPSNDSQVRDDIIAAIETEFPASEEMKNYTFQKVAAQGSSDNRNFSNSGNGVTSVDSRSYTDTGSSSTIEGLAGSFENNTPAQIVTDHVVPDTIEITSDSNQMQLTINGMTRSFNITEGLYTRAALVQAIQDKINSEFDFGDTYKTPATVSLNADNKLVFTCGLEYKSGWISDGSKTSISCSTSSSSLLKKLHTTETTAKMTTKEPLQSTISITDDTKSFTFIHNGNPVTVELDAPAIMSATNFANKLDTLLDAYGISADLDDYNRLVLETDAKGTGNTLSYNSTNGGTITEALFGNLVTPKRAEGTARQTLQENIKIESGVSDTFNVEINGTSYAISLIPEEYDRESFVAMLEDKLKDKGLHATLNSNGQITYYTEATGSTASFVVDYDTGGTAMQAMYGQYKVEHPGVKAEFDANGKLVLSGTGSGNSVSVKPAADSGILPPTETVTKTPPRTENGYSSTKTSFIQGYGLTAPIKIDEWNDKLEFTYTDGSTNPVTEKNFNLTVPPKDDYTYAELQTVLQQAIDDQINTPMGENVLNATVTASGVRIEATKPGSNYTLSGFSGDFYRKVIGKCEKKTEQRSTVDIDGKQVVDSAYTIGRKNIRDNGAVIRTGVNDTLSLDFTYGPTSAPVTTKITFALDPGEYGGTALVQEIQEKMGEALKNAGLAENAIKAQIGGVSTGVTGANDSAALVFKLNPDAKLPDAGEYIIDGVSGNAAFSVFYQTEGELEPAYITGTKDITEGVTLKDGETVLSFDVDGTNYSIDLDPAGEYTATEIIDKINAKLTAQSIPVLAVNENNNVRLMYTSLGKHTISNVSGPAKEELFFQENSGDGTREGVKIQLSSNAGDSLEIDRPIVNTSFLHINSIAITKPKYANKALERLQQALERVSEVRSNFGASQNRLEHATANNCNTSENTQAAESRLRDTNMANEMVENSKYAILQQATEAVMAQGKVQAENIIKLLQF